MISLVERPRTGTINPQVFRPPQIRAQFRRVAKVLEANTNTYAENRLANGSPVSTVFISPMNNRPAFGHFC